MSAFHLALNAWLQTADTNYISGRLLWTQWLVDGASNLLWLSIEQMIKILVLQSNLPKLDSGNATSEQAHRAIDRAALSIARDHSRTSLVAALSAAHPSIDLSPHLDTMAKLEEYYRRRYYINQGTSIGLMLLHKVDALYFVLRSHVAPELGVGTIDEIGIRRKHGWGQTLPAFEFAYRDNLSFAPRRHSVINIMGPNGANVTEDGSSW